VCRALGLVDWRVLTVKQLRKRFGVKDREIIPACAKRGIAWITADESAESDHVEAIRTHRLSVLFVRRHPENGLGRPYQLALVAAAIGHFESLLEPAGDTAILCEVRWQCVDGVTVEVLEHLPRYRKLLGRQAPAVELMPPRRRHP
jgi:hypothetical protein